MVVQDFKLKYGYIPPSVTMACLIWLYPPFCYYGLLNMGIPPPPPPPIMLLWPA